MKKQGTYSYKNCSVHLYKTKSKPCVLVQDCNNCTIIFPDGKTWNCSGAATLQCAFDIAIEKINKTIL